MREEESAPSITEPSPSSLNQRPTKIHRVRSDESIDGGEQTEEMTGNPRVQRYLVAKYIGTRFAGAQQQPNHRDRCRSSRGVHALANVCYIDVEHISKRKPGEVLPPHEPAVVKRAINHFLQKDEDDVMVIDVRCVASSFHARYKAQERTYFYRLLSGPEPLSAFEKDRAWHVHEDLDIRAMQRACKVLVGHHDFSSFRAASCQAKSPIRTLEELNVTKVVFTPYFPSIRDRGSSDCIGEDPIQCSNGSKTDLPFGSLASYQDEHKSSNGEVGSIFGLRKSHRCYVVTARSRSFLYHQVRLLVGVLKCVGTGEITISNVERVLKAKTVTAVSPMAPACGPFLGIVKYDLQ